MPWGIGTESLGMIGCIFAENGPLEGGIESSLNGTGWGAKVDFRWFSYLYPYIFQSRTLVFFKAHALSYTHSKVGNDWMHIRGEMTSGKWTWSGFVRSRLESLRWFEVDFWPLCVHFRRSPPPPPPPFSESTCPEVWAQKVWQWWDVYSRRMGL